MQTGSFKAGKQHGIWKRYRENGKPYDEGQFVDGKKSGVWKTYDEAGQLSKSKTY